MFRSILALSMIGVAAGVGLRVTSTAGFIQHPSASDADVNKDGSITSADIGLVAHYFGARPGTPTATTTPSPIPSPTATPTSAAGSPDLLITLDQSKPSVIVGELVTYTLTARNLGDTRGAYTFELDAPVEIEPVDQFYPSFGQANGTIVSCSGLGSPPRLQCHVPDGIPAGQFVQVTLTGVFRSAGSFTAVALGNANGSTDSNPDNDADSVTTIVVQ